MLIFFIIFIGIISKVYLSCDLEAACKIPYIKNGNYSTIIYSLKPIIEFHCNKNYTLNGQKRNRCVCGRWLNPLPVCHKLSNVLPECTAPYIQKGWVECLTVGCNRFFVGTEAAIRCERGYQLVGSSRLHCRRGNQQLGWKATWSSPVPKCVQIDGEYADVNQQGQSVEIFYTENSSIMVIIIILSVLACGLMLLISAMLMNRLVKRRRLLRFQRSDHSSSNNRTAPPAMSETDGDQFQNRPTEQNATTNGTRQWNCFTRNSSRYQHMDTQGTDNITTVEQECTPAVTPELYNHPICSDDRESLINPPCYEEAIKCSQYSIVLPSHPSAALLSKTNKKSKHGDILKITKREKLKHVPIRPTITSANTELTNTIQPESSLTPLNTSLQSTDTLSNNIVDNNGSVQSVGGHRLSDVDSVSRRSARVHYSRVVNNISAESNNSFLSGSIETMAVSDGTSVTVHTFDSSGSNPSIGSMRPQTGSIGDPATFINHRSHPVRYAAAHTGTFIESDFPDIGSGQRYSPPPSYESSINNPISTKHIGRSCRSNTASPSATSNMALFVDNMANNNDTPPS